MSGAVVIFFGVVWAAGGGVHPGRTDGDGVGVGVLVAVALAELDADASDVEVAAVTGSSAVGFGAVITLATQTKPITTASTARTAKTGCLSRTGHTFQRRLEGATNHRQRPSLGKVPRPVGIPRSRVHDIAGCKRPPNRLDPC